MSHHQNRQDNRLNACHRRISAQTRPFATSMAPPEVDLTYLPPRSNASKHELIIFPRYRHPRPVASYPHQHHAANPLRPDLQNHLHASSRARQQLPKNQCESPPTRTIFRLRHGHIHISRLLRVDRSSLQHRASLSPDLNLSRQLSRNGKMPRRHHAQV